MKKKRSVIDYMVLLGLVLLSLVCLLRVSISSNQARLSSPIPLDFSGEYSYDGENWLPLTEDADLSPSHGSVTLRGHFDIEIGEGGCFNYYRNHIGVSFFRNGECFAMDAITDLAARGAKLMPSMCGREWLSVSSPGITPEDEVEIHLYNPHAHGNGSAYRDFLNTLCAGPDIAVSDLMQKNLQPYGGLSRVLGALFLVVGLMLLGEAMASTILRAAVGRKLLNLGLTTLFTGAFFLFDTIDVCFWSSLVVLNTYTRQLCAMLAVLCFGYCVCGGLTGKICRTARAGVLLSALLDGVLIGLSLTGTVLIFDTYIYWAAFQCFLCPLLAACCIVQLHCVGKKNVLVLVSCVLLCGTILLDIAGVGASILSHGTCTKGMFCLVFLVYVFAAIKGILVGYQASAKVQKLEQELQESRISIMLSQLQPHFLFNVLNTIYYLCGSQPEKARKVVDKFSTYLRDNLESLDQKEMVPFQKEFDHIQTYLELEKIRFEEELTVVYDIQADQFYLPVLTVQPLVENAVKHGITKKRGGGVLTLSTREQLGSFVITVSDTGIGFDPEHYLDDGKIHVGIENVRLRLEDMAGGMLKITSSPGGGTTAVITIPKKEASGK